MKGCCWGKHWLGAASGGGGGDGGGGMVRRGVLRCVFVRLFVYLFVCMCISKK